MGGCIFPGESSCTDDVLLKQDLETGAATQLEMQQNVAPKNSVLQTCFTNLLFQRDTATASYDEN